MICCLNDILKIFELFCITLCIDTNTFVCELVLANTYILGYKLEWLLHTSVSYLVLLVTFFIVGYHT